VVANTSEQHTDVEQAEKIVADLKARTEACLTKGRDIAARRHSLSYDALVVKDVKAQKALAQLALDAAQVGNDITTLTSAITEADARLADVQRAEAVAADKANARQVTAVIEELVEAGQVLDDCLHDAVEAGDRLRAGLNRLHNLGVGPSHEMLLSLYFYQRVTADVSPRTWAGIRAGLFLLRR
jgi:hypothetical protein